MEDDLRAPRRRPTGRFRITPSLMADRDPKRNAIDLEEASLPVGHVIRRFLQWKLVLALESLHRSIAVHHHGGIVRPQLGFPLDPHDRRHLMRRARLTDPFQRRRLPRLVLGRHEEIEPAQSGDIRLWKTDDRHLLVRRLGQHPVERVQTFRYCRGVRHGRESNSKRRHVRRISSTWADRAGTIPADEGRRVRGPQAR